MAKFYKDVEVETEVDLYITVQEFYEEMDDDEIHEMSRLIKTDKRRLIDKDFYLSDLFYNCTDSEILNSEKILGKLAYFLKYEDSTLLEFMRGELK